MLVERENGLLVRRCGDRAEWLEARTEYLGASDAPVIMGLDPWRSPLAVWVEKRVGPQETEESEPMYWGNRLEGVVADEYTTRTARETWQYDPFDIVVSRERTWQAATIDRFVGGERPGVLEVKTASAYRAGDWTDAAPMHYQIQLQHQLAVTDYQWGSLAVLIGGQQFRFADIERDDELIAEMLEREETFWKSVVSGAEPPASLASDADLIRARYEQPLDGLVVDLPFEAQDLDEELQELKSRQSQLEDRIKVTTARLQQMLGDAEVGVLPNGVRYSWRVQKRKGYVVDESEARVFRRLKPA